MLIIDALQYVNWTRALFEEAKAGGVNAIHVTIAYWENTRDALENIGDWRQRFRDHEDIIMPVHKASDILDAQKLGKIGIIFGFQNCSPIEDDLRMVETLYDQGVRIMQLTYNNQSLLATGCYEEGDSGVTRFGREVIKEMNRVGMVIDMSHSAEHSTLQTIELSQRPIAITHANPSRWHEALRNKSDDVLKALGQSGGMLGFSMYPFHLNDGPDCSLDDFCGMIMDTAELMGIDNIGIGSDLCQNWGYETLEWMRSGKWTFKPDYGEGSASNADWPRQPDWFESSKDFGNIAEGLSDKGMAQRDIEKVMGGNWYRFFEASFEPL
ncbi:dipeptidase [Hellea balneolensis]|uniref:dipeptidase n=1 Tax=Hellea balneolensis TaxID=287478 RepID=UPI0004200AEA|nr:dipeptidase [Hellea balneolensis]